MFSCEFCEISKNTFFTEQLWTSGSEQRARSLETLRDVNISIFSLHNFSETQKPITHKLQYKNE